MWLTQSSHTEPIHLAGWQVLAAPTAIGLAQDKFVFLWITASLSLFALSLLKKLLVEAHQISVKVSES